MSHRMHAVCQTVPLKFKANGQVPRLHITETCNTDLYQTSCPIRNFWAIILIEIWLCMHGSLACRLLMPKLTRARSRFPYAVEPLVTLGIDDRHGKMVGTASGLRIRFIFIPIFSAMPSKQSFVKWSLHTSEYAVGSLQSALFFFI